MRNIAVLLGMPRAATTFIYHHLDTHPDVYVPFRRKTNYFSIHFDEKNEGWFFNHFKCAKASQIGLETETLGFVDKHINIIERLEKTLGSEAKFILCVRHPADWAYSFYRQIQTFDTELLHFNQFLSGKYILKEDDKRILFNYSNGDLSRRISKLIEHFDKRLLLIDFKDFETSPYDCLCKIESFLELQPYFASHSIDSSPINSSSRKNSTIVSSFLRNRAFIKALSYFPPTVVKNLRKSFDRHVSRKRIEKITPPSLDIKLAERHFSEDITFYKTLFRDS